MYPLPRVGFLSEPPLLWKFYFGFHTWNLVVNCVLQSVLKLLILPPLNFKFKNLRRPCTLTRKSQPVICRHWSINEICLLLDVFKWNSCDFSSSSCSWNNRNTRQRNPTQSKYEKINLISVCCCHFSLWESELQYFRI